MQVLRRPVDTAAALAWADERLAWRRECGGPGPSDSPQPMLVVAHPEQGADEDGHRKSDKPDSKENQPEGHALPVIAYRELNSMLHQLQDASLVSSRTVRRNPARPVAQTLRGRSCQGGNGNAKFTRGDWTGGAFWVTSIPRASWTPCSRPREAQDVVALIVWKGDPAFTDCRSLRRFGVSRDCLISPEPGTAITRPAHSPVHSPSPRPQSAVAISLSRLNAFGPETDVVPYGPCRGNA
jgi:hypothetical protein